jgi:hypothetical protein
MVERIKGAFGDRGYRNEKRAESSGDMIAGQSEEGLPKEGAELRGRSGKQEK